MGYLKEFTHSKGKGSERSWEHQHREKRKIGRGQSPKREAEWHKARNHLTGRIVNMIEGGTYGGASESALKKHIRRPRTYQGKFELFEIKRATGKKVITFDDSNKRGICYPHEDASHIYDYSQCGSP